MRVYYDEDADVSIINGRTIAVLGYGNQGRAQALNMRESGLRVVIGNIKDAYWDRAVADGFEVYSLEDAAQRGDVVFLLVPDEAQRGVYEAHVEKALAPGKALVFAHGYNIHYGFIVPPPFVDVVMVAPRMIGVAVRELYAKGSGANAFVAVHQDASGKAKSIALALAKAIGATRAGAFEVSFADETEMDHFMEQATWAGIMRILTLSFETLVEAGYPPEVVALEMYGSGEAAEIFEEMAKTGFFKQMSYHSRTSQYGTMTRGPRIIPEQVREVMHKTIEEIKTGVFAREWEMEQRLGYPVFNKLKERALNHPINKAENAVKALLRVPA